MGIFITVVAGIVVFLIVRQRRSTFRQPSLFHSKETNKEKTCDYKVNTNFNGCNGETEKKTRKVSLQQIKRKISRQEGKQS